MFWAVSGRDQRFQVPDEKRYGLTVTTVSIYLNAGSEGVVYVSELLKTPRFSLYHVDYESYRCQ